MTKYIAGLVSGVLCALAAGWLILAPFALGYQPAGQAWSDATRTELWTGIGLLVLALAAAVLYAAGWRASCVSVACWRHGRRDGPARRRAGPPG
jgi:hypothetical protein